MIVNDEARVAWLKSLKEGDTVALRVHSYYTPPYEILQVARRTSTQLICTAGARAMERRFNADDGSERGYGKYGQIEPATEGIRCAVEQSRLVAWAESVKWKPLPLETLRAVRKIVEGSPS